MSTSAPIRKEYDIPIIEPCPVPALPKSLPEVAPERIVQPFVVTQPERVKVEQPVVVPVRQPERVRVEV